MNEPVPMYLCPFCYNFLGLGFHPYKPFAASCSSMLQGTCPPLTTNYFSFKWSQALERIEIVFSSIDDPCSKDIGLVFNLVELLMTCI